MTDHMTRFIAELSTDGLMLALVCVMLVGPVLFSAIRRVAGETWFRSDEAAAIYLNMISIFYGLLLGLVTIELWQKTDAAQTNSSNEIGAIRALFLVAKSIPGEREALTGALATYVQSVIQKDWPLMVTQSKNLFAFSQELDAVREHLMNLAPKTSAEQAAFQQALSYYGEIVNARQQRILESEQSLPGVLRLTLIAGAIFTWVSTCFISSRHSRSQLLLTSFTSGYLFMLLYLILVLENPFIGSWRVDSSPYQQILAVLK